MTADGLDLLDSVSSVAMMVSAIVSGIYLASPLVLLLLPNVFGAMVPTFPPFTCAMVWRSSYL